MKRVIFTLIILLVAVKVNATITVTEPDNLRVYQRDWTSVNITFSGTYDCSSPTVIEYRIVNNGTDTFVTGHDWQTLDAAPAGGTFSGTASSVPQGGWYNVDVRCDQSGSEVDGGTNKFGVGILVGWIGQSNPRWMIETATALTPDDLLSMNTNYTWSTVPGSGAISFGNTIITALGIPVGIISNPIGGSGLRYESRHPIRDEFWTDYNSTYSTIYDDFILYVDDVGGSLEFIFWGQGENDANVSSETEYKTALIDLIGQLRSEIVNGSSETNLPFILSILGRNTSGVADSGWQDIRNAQELVAVAVADTYIGAGTIDLELRDNVHYTYAENEVVGSRLAQTVLYILGEESDYRGPRFDYAREVDATHTDILLQVNRSRDFTPAANALGFEIVEGAGSWGIPTSTYKINGITLRMTHSSMTGTRKVRVLYGANPDIYRPLYDTTTIGLPVESHDESTVEALKGMLDSSGVHQILYVSGGDTALLKDSSGSGI